MARPNNPTADLRLAVSVTADAYLQLDAGLSDWHVHVTDPVPSPRTDAWVVGLRVYNGKPMGDLTDGLREGQGELEVTGHVASTSNRELVQAIIEPVRREMERIVSEMIGPTTPTLLRQLDEIKKLCNLGDLPQVVELLQDTLVMAVEVSGYEPVTWRRSRLGYGNRDARR